jgi:hypothetical protein
MQLTPSQGAMLMLLGTDLPRLRRNTLAQTIRDGRAMLRSITRKDFGYDPEAWHNYLCQTDYGGYRWSDKQDGIRSQIQEAIDNPEWRASVEGLKDREQRKEQERAETFTRRTSAKPSTE